MKTISITFIVFGLHLQLYGYSGADLRGTSVVRQIGQAVYLYANENNGVVDIPYSEIRLVKQFSSGIDRGVIAFPPHTTYSSDPASPSAVVYFSVDNMVAVGFSDGTATYYEREDRPPWVRLRSGPSLYEWLIGSSLLLNIVLILFYGGNYLSKKLKK